MPKPVAIHEASTLWGGLSTDTEAIGHLGRIHLGRIHLERTSEDSVDISSSACSSKNKSLYRPITNQYLWIYQAVTKRTI